MARHSSGAAPETNRRLNAVKLSYFRRSEPRSPGTIKTNLNWALPTLRAWAEDGHQSLREITRDDVLVAMPARERHERLSATGSGRSSPPSSPAR